ncbi:MAG: YidC/Oxa1 family membrane protein insertase [Clostridia bacterium]|nr:YidC/Oxa1 family membrane protein insertase [Clostridia bacterium]
MAFLMSAVDVTAPSGLWEWLIINVFGFIGNYGWRIVVLVVFLKLLLSPLDFYQKYKMRKNQRITENLQIQMKKLEKQYGADKRTLQQKQMELQKKAGFSYMSACLPMIVTLVLFITFYTALRSVSAYMEFRQYVEMHDAYVISYTESGFDYKMRTNESMRFRYLPRGLTRTKSTTG